MKTYHPQIRLRLIKTIRREDVAVGTTAARRYRELPIDIDLLPWLGEGGGVRVSKSIREPAGGFTLSFLDRIDLATLDTLYASIEPMDLIEIRMAHDPSEYAKTGTLPIMMRGFVSSVRREEAMSANGQPSRRVTVQGQDYGKIWQMFQIYYLQNQALGELYLSPFKFLEKFGTQFDTMLPVGGFFADFLAQVLDPYLQGLTWAGNKTIPGLVSQFTPAVSVDGTVSPFTLASFNGGSAWQLLSELLDVGPFNELYVEDTETAVLAVLRPTPFRSVAGDFVQSGATAETIRVPRSDVQSIASERSDRDVANYFWATSPHWALIRDGDLRLAAQQGSAESMQSFGEQNSSLGRYSLRRLEESTAMGPPGVLSNAGDGDANTERSAGALETGWLEQRRLTLKAQNKDNVVFESGAIRMRGNERIKPGRYVRLTPSADPRDDGPMYYAVRVDHEFMPFQGYFTTVQYERGTGFIDRAQSPVSPYWTEMDVGGIR